jgi:hypothetical protein
MTTPSPTVRLSRIDCARFVVLILVAVGCATTQAARVEITLPPRTMISGDSDRILVAGFVAGAVSDRVVDIDVNDETARFVRTALRKASLPVIDADPLRLQASRKSAAAETVAIDPDDVFTDAQFWQRLGEEYGRPLILTGTVTFDSVGPRYEERTVGVRTIRVWHRGFRLGGTMMLINGSTAEIVDSLTLRPSRAYATMGRESALSLYFQLMDSAMPSIFRLLGQQTTTARLLLR